MSRYKAAGLARRRAGSAAGRARSPQESAPGFRETRYASGSFAKGPMNVACRY